MVLTIASVASAGSIATVTIVGTMLMAVAQQSIAVVTRTMVGSDHHGVNRGGTCNNDAHHDECDGTTDRQVGNVAVVVMVITPSVVRW